jgi:hypothetical protein
MRPKNPSNELSPGGLFIHGQVNAQMAGGPLYCRIRSFDGASSSTTGRMRQRGLGALSGCRSRASLEAPWPSVRTHLATAGADQIAAGSASTDGSAERSGDDRPAREELREWVHQVEGQPRRTIRVALAIDLARAPLPDLPHARLLSV